MERYTLDTNCLIALAKPEPASPHVRAIIQGFRDGTIDLAIPAIAALERQQNRLYLDHFDAFRARLGSLGISDIPLVHAIAHYGIGFYGVGLIPDDSMLELERQIQSVIHPEVEFSLADFCKARGLPFDPALPPHRWRNAKCDVQALWSHIHHGRSCFITSDDDFYGSTIRPRLEALGVGRILSPQAAAAELANAA